MKKALLFSGLLLAVNVLFAQWSSSGTNVYLTTGTNNVGIGTSTPGYPLQVIGLINANGVITRPASAGGWAQYIQGPTGGDANILLQGNVTGSSPYQAFWISGANGYLALGGSGGSEPSKGAINIDGNGNVGVNTTNTTSGYKFSVAGSAVFDAVTVTTYSSNKPNATPWADYVFDKNYQLPSLYTLADYIKTKNHLPGIPTTEEVKKNGLDLGAIQAKLLEKIEQLTLYTIQLQQQVDNLKAENEKFASLQQQIDELKQNRQ
jgi:hypothetical protein